MNNDKRCPILGSHTRTDGAVILGCQACINAELADIQAQRLANGVRPFRLPSTAA